MVAAESAAQTLPCSGHDLPLRPTVQQLQEISGVLAEGVARVAAASRDPVGHKPPTPPIDDGELVHPEVAPQPDPVGG